jgi:hypothetical protein
MAESTAMTLRQVLFAGLLFALLASAATASSFVIRDSIGPDNPATNGVRSTALGLSSFKSDSDSLKNQSLGTFPL